MRELLYMAEGHSRDIWSATSAMMALIANVNRDPRKHRPYEPKDFNPHGKEVVAEGVVEKSDLSVARRFFKRKK